MEYDQPYLALAGLPRNEYKDAFLLAVDQDEKMIAMQNPWIKDRRYYGCTPPQARLDTWIAEDPFTSFAKILDEKGLAQGKIGLDMENLTVDIYEELRKALPEAIFKDTSDLFWKMRMIKSQEEIARMKKSNEIAVKATINYYNLIREGISGTELSDILNYTYKSLGAEYKFAHGGWNRGEPEGSWGAPRGEDYEPTYRLKKGDAGSLDTGCTYKGYYSDIARSGVVGDPTPEQLAAHKATVKTNETLRNTIKAGVKAGDLYQLVVSVMKKEGFHLIYSMVGHGIGLHVHEPPYITAEDETILEEGMTVAVEIALSKEKNFWFNCEDVVLVTKEGSETLTDLNRDIRMIKGNLPSFS